MKGRVFLGLASILMGLSVAPANGQPPPTLQALFEQAPRHDPDVTLGEGQRQQAMRLAALGYGSQAGLARRSWEIQRILERHARQLDRIYRFREMMLRARGFTIMPPVLTRTTEAFRLGRSGLEAARSRRILRILEPARIVGAPPRWRDYLRRSWSKAQPPSSVLFPRTEAETALWTGWVRDGWRQGRRLADDIFASDLDRLNRVFQGVVLWRRAWRSRIATRPGISFETAPVRGGGARLDIGETRIRIARPSGLDAEARNWTLAVEVPPGD